MQCVCILIENGSIVVVPDASSSRATNLGDSSWVWLSNIAKEAHLRTVFYEFQYHPVTKSGFVWQALSDGGDTFLALLLKLEETAEVIAHAQQPYRWT